MKRNLSNPLSPSIFGNENSKPKKEKKNYRGKVAARRQRQGYKMKGDDGHWASVDPKTGKFLKSSKHPTVHKETDWYKSDSAKDFRKENKLVTKNVFGRERKYYKYKKRK